MKPKFYVHRFNDLYASGCSAEIRVERQGTVYSRWVRAVCIPYPGSQLQAAWEVLRGRAFAFEWPKPGDFEEIEARTSSLSPSKKPNRVGDD